MRKSRRKRRRRRLTRRARRGGGKKGKKGKTNLLNNLTDGELSVEKTIEGQQARNDGGGAGQAASRRHYEEAGLFNNAPKKAPKKDTYYYSKGFKAIGNDSLRRPKSGLAQALESASPEAKVMAERAILGHKARAIRRERGGRVSGKLVAARRRLGDINIESRNSLAADAAAGRARVTPTDANRFDFNTVTPWGNLSSLNQDEVAAADAESELTKSAKEAAEKQKKKKGDEEDRKRWAAAANEAAAAAVNDDKVVNAANQAAAEVLNDELVATGGVSPLPPDAGGSRRRGRRGRRSRTRKKRAGYGPITTGGWAGLIPQLLPSQHLGSLGMWI